MKITERSLWECAWVIAVVVAVGSLSAIVMRLAARVEVLEALVQ